jgi:hypothetical protein
MKYQQSQEPFVDDTKFVVDLLRSAFIKLQNVGKAFHIKAPHEVDKDSSKKGLAFRIHRLAEKLENLPVVKLAGRHFVFEDGGSDGEMATTVATTVTMTGLRRRRPTN